MKTSKYMMNIISYTINNNDIIDDNMNFVDFFSNVISCENTTIQTVFIFSSPLLNKKKTKAEIIKRLKLKKYYKCKSKDIYCTICCETIKEKEYVRDLKCNHQFHKRCIDHWLVISIKELEDIQCPLCREKIEWY